MRSINSHFPIGFGSFVEKTVMAYISTTPANLRNSCRSEQNYTSPFSYKNGLSFTDKGEFFNDLVGHQPMSENLDSLEGGFDAIIQVAVLILLIGWRSWEFYVVFQRQTERLTLLQWTEIHSPPPQWHTPPRRPHLQTVQLPMGWAYSNHHNILEKNCSQWADKIFP